MTLSTYGMQDRAYLHFTGNSPNPLMIEIIRIIEENLPKEIRGCIKGLEHVRDDHGLGGYVNVFAAFPDYPTTNYRVEVPVMIQEGDIVEKIIETLSQEWSKLNS